MTGVATRSPRPKPDHRDNENGEQRLILFDVSWQSYLAIGNALADRPALRLTFDRGNLEFMTTSPKHEIYKKWFSRFIDILAEELNRPKISAGNMTFQREDLDRGIEADDSFWIIHEPAMRGKLTWDPKIDPPPDLGLEIEISRSVLNRLDIYAALRILEVWCFNGMAVRIYRLQADGTYQQVQESQLFPKVPLGELVRFFALIETTDDLTVTRQFREWVRQFVGQ